MVYAYHYSSKQYLHQYAPMSLTPKMERIVDAVLEKASTPREIYCGLVKQSLLEQLTWGEIQKVIAEADLRTEHSIRRLYIGKPDLMSMQLQCEVCDEVSNRSGPEETDTN